MILIIKFEKRIFKKSKMSIILLMNINIKLNLK